MKTWVPLVRFSGPEFIPAHSYDRALANPTVSILFLFKF
jgi:hypothetical protein